MEQYSAWKKAQQEKLQTNAPETWLRKVVRHVLAGEFDRRSIQSGIQQARELLATRHYRDSIFTPSETKKNYLGHKGLTVQVFEAVSDKVKDKKITAAYVTDFPEDCQIQPQVYGTTNLSKTISSVLNASEAIASIVGPTFIREYPNNGFFALDLGGTLQPFNDTNPPGERRGALAFTENGEMRILDEETKLAARSDYFKGYSVVAGTSSYITSEDTEFDVTANENHTRERARVTYLVQYTDRRGALRFAHVIFVIAVTRDQVRQLLFSHSQKNKWENFIAAELEFWGGDCVVKDEDRISHSVARDKLTYEQDRLDHYLVYRRSK